MATKIYANGNYIVVEVAGKPEPLQDGKGKVTVVLLKDTNKLYRIQSERIGFIEIELADIQDEAGAPYNLASWTTFYRENTNFNPASGGSGAVDSVAGKTGDVVLISSDIESPNDGVSAHAVNVEEWLNHIWSAGALNGFDVTENGDGTVTLTDGDVVIRAIDDDGSQLKTFNVTGGISGINFPDLTDNDQNFIFCRYNAGVPDLFVTLDPKSIDGRTEIPLWIVVRVGNDTHIQDLRGYGTDFALKETRKTFFVNGYEHEPGGSVVTEIGTRNLNLTPGTFHIANIETPHIGFDTSVAGTFTKIYTTDSGATWTRTTGETQIDNINYNDITSGLVPLSNNSKYGVHWVCLVINNPDLLYVLIGQAEYNSEAEAEAAKLPSILPPEVQAFSTGVLVAKVIQQKNTTNFADIQSPFETKLTSQSASIHNSLGGLNVGDFQHLTAVQLAQLNAWKPPSIPLGGILTSGASFFINGGAGIYVSFSGASDDALFLNDSLSRDSAIQYDGSDMALKLHWRISANGGVGDTVGWVVDYAFVRPGDNSSTTITSIAQQDVDVSGELQDIDFDTILGTMSGLVGAHVIMLTLTRNSTGAGSDSFSGNAEIVGLEWVKI